MWRVRVKVMGTQNIVYLLRSSIFFSISASSLKERIKELMGSVVKELSKFLSEQSFLPITR